MSLLSNSKRKIANMAIVGALAITPLLQAPTALADTPLTPQAGVSSSQNTEYYHTLTASEYVYSCRHIRLWYCGRYYGW